ncbi:MAG: helix-turn-helix domain-containing protein [Deltaproteobacteria bacterium]|nr:helix-turn-helix domain-containing protein [Deltaproteobacteria bacterium]
MARRHSELVSVTEAARQLGVSLSTVWRRIRRGELPSVRLHGRRQIAQVDLYLPITGSDLDRIPPFTRGNPIFSMIGIGNSGAKGPGSEDKYAILATELDSPRYAPPARRRRKPRR